MSAALFASDVLFFQRFLQTAGLYQGKLDGLWGPKTDAGAAAFDEITEELAERHGRFDRATERHVGTLHPKAQEAARLFMAKVTDAGISARVISGTRTYEEQNALFRKGRFGNPPPVVTKARGGQSNHNFGIAWDIGIFDGGRYLGASPLYARAAQVGKAPGLEWGGDWKSFQDQPHYQLAVGGPIRVVRASFERGAVFV